MKKILVLCIIATLIIGGIGTIGVNQPESSLSASFLEATSALDN
jgi:hypothetical protein